MQNSIEDHDILSLIEDHDLLSLIEDLPMSVYKSIVSMISAIIHYSLISV
jgi:hypothetical protein